MAKAAILFSVLVLGWTWSLQGVHTEEEVAQEQVIGTEAPAVNETHFNQTEVCVLEPEVGPCKAFVEHMFYNSTSKSCEVFNYGGCAGNLNNFENKTECMDKCHMEVEEAPTEASN